MTVSGFLSFVYRGSLSPRSVPKSTFQTSQDHLFCTVRLNRQRSWCRVESFDSRHNPSGAIPISSHSSSSTQIFPLLASAIERCGMSSLGLGQNRSVMLSVPNLHLLSSQSQPVTCEDLHFDAWLFFLVLPSPSSVVSNIRTVAPEKGNQKFDAACIRAVSLKS